MFKKILIANRGEIAVRIMAACREMHIRTVAVYSEVDRYAQHVRVADEAYEIGLAPAVESYLHITRVIEVAKKCGAEAIHPGGGPRHPESQCGGTSLPHPAPAPRKLRNYTTGTRAHARCRLLDACERSSPMRRAAVA